MGGVVDAISDAVEWCEDAAESIGKGLDKAFSKDGVFTNFVQDWIPGGGLVTAIVHSAAGNDDYAEYAAVKGVGTALTAAAAVAGTMLAGPAGSLLVGMAAGALAGAAGAVLANLWESGLMKQYLQQSVKKKIPDLSLEGILIDAATGAIGGAAGSALGKGLKAVGKKLGGIAKKAGGSKIGTAFKKVGSGIAAPFKKIGSAIAYPIKKISAGAGRLGTSLKNGASKISTGFRRLRGKPPKKAPLTRTGGRQNLHGPTPGDRQTAATVDRLKGATKKKMILKPTQGVIAETAGVGEQNKGNKEEIIKWIGGTPAGPKPVDPVEIIKKIAVILVPILIAIGIIAAIRKPTTTVAGSPPVGQVATTDPASDNAGRLNPSPGKKTSDTIPPPAFAAPQPPSGDGTPVATTTTTTAAGSTATPATTTAPTTTMPASPTTTALGSPTTTTPAGTTTSTSTTTTSTTTTTVKPKPMALLVYRDVCYYDGPTDPNNNFGVILDTQTVAADGTKATIVMNSNVAGQSAPINATVEDFGEIVFYLYGIQPGWTLSVVSLVADGISFSTDFGTYTTPPLEDGYCYAPG